VSAIGIELAQVGIAIAIARGDTRRMFMWAEMLRANALRSPPVMPPDSPQLRKSATDLRRLSLEIRTAERRGHSVRALSL
jgi:hypothetical protein